MSLEMDKCELCALKVTFDQDIIHGDAAKTENFINVLRKLQSENIIEKGYNRRAYASNTGEGDKTVMCAVNSKFFLPKNKEKNCPHFILNMGFTTPEALSLNVAKSTDKLTNDIHKMTLIIMGLTVLAVVATLFSVLR